MSQWFTLDKLTLSYFFIAIAAFVATQLLYGLLSKPVVRRLELNRRMKMILNEGNREDVFVELMKARGLTKTGGYRYPLFRRFNSLIVQSGTTAGLEIIVLMILLFTLAVYGIFIFYLRLEPLLSVPLGLGLGIGLPILFLVRLRARRRRAFSDQLPDALELIARSLKAGHPLPVALTLASREVSDPLGSEFGIMSDEMAYGYSLSRALRNLESRVGQEDLSVLATGIIIQSEVGGNLIELVSSLANLMRDRVKLRRKVRTLTSEGRFSGAALSVLPLLMFLALQIVAPVYYGAVWGKSAVTTSLVIAMVWMLLGNLVIYRMVNFKF